jgi:hypothetical protein
MCGAICQAQMCSPPQAGAEKSFARIFRRGGRFYRYPHQLDAELHFAALLVALPASFRSVSGDSPLFAHAERNASPRRALASNSFKEQTHNLLSSCSAKREV